MQQFPQLWQRAAPVMMEAVLLKLQELTPPYPPPPPNSTYRRTLTLGKSLGIGMGLGARPDIREVALGPQMVRGTYGTRVRYAPEVIGAGTQKAVHRGRWWTLEFVAYHATPEVVRIMQVATDEMAQWLGGNRGGA